MKKRYLLPSLTLAVVILLCACARTDANVEPIIPEDGAASTVEPVLPPPEQTADEKPKPASVADVPIESVPMPDETPVESEPEVIEPESSIETDTNGMRYATIEAYRAGCTDEIILDYLYHDFTGDGKDELVVAVYDTEDNELTECARIVFWNPDYDYAVVLSYGRDGEVVQYLRGSLCVNENGTIDASFYAGSSEWSFETIQFGYSIVDGVQTVGALDGQRFTLTPYVE